MVTLSSINFNTSSSRTSWKNLLDLIYPKGSVYYRTASATVPGVSFGGNWEIKNYSCPTIARLKPVKSSDNNNTPSLQSVYQLGDMVFGYGWFDAAKAEPGNSSWTGLTMMTGLPAPDEAGWTNTDNMSGCGLCGINNSERIENIFIKNDGSLAIGANGGNAIQTGQGGPYNFIYKAKDSSGLDNATFFSERVYQHIRTS